MHETKDARLHLYICTQPRMRPAAARWPRAHAPRALRRVPSSAARSAAPSRHKHAAERLGQHALARKLGRPAARRRHVRARVRGRAVGAGLHARRELQRRGLHRRHGRPAPRQARRQGSSAPLRPRWLVAAGDVLAHRASTRTRVTKTLHQQAVAACRAAGRTAPAPPCTACPRPRRRPLAAGRSPRRRRRPARRPAPVARRRRACPPPARPGGGSRRARPRPGAGWRARAGARLASLLGGDVRKVGALVRAQPGLSGLHIDALGQVQDCAARAAPCHRAFRVVKTAGLRRRCE